MRLLLIALIVLGTLQSARAEVLVITHAVIHPASGPAINDATIVVTDGRISALGTAAAPAGATVIDAHGQHLYPSLIDADTSLGLLEIEAVRSTRDNAEMGRINANARADIAFNPDSQLLPVAMSAGILVAGVSPRGSLIAGRTATMQLSGWTREDMTLKAPSGLLIRWPTMTIGRQAWSPPARKQEKARREALRELDEAFENARAYGKAKAEEPDVQWDAIGAALRGEIPVVVMANGVDEINAALAWTAKQKVRMVLLGGRDAWRVAPKLAAAHVPVIYSGLLAIPDRDYESYQTWYQAPAKLAAAGVTVSLSSGGGGSNVRYLSDLGGRAHAYGLGALESLQAITLHPAEALGVADRVGSLAVGKDATFFLADGDILDTRTHVLRAWMRGQELDLNDRQKKLWEKYRARPRRQGRRSTCQEI